MALTLADVMQQTQQQNAQKTQASVANLGTNTVNPWEWGTMSAAAKSNYASQNQFKNTIEAEKALQTAWSSSGLNANQITSGTGTRAEQEAELRRLSGNNQQLYSQLITEAHGDKFVSGNSDVAPKKYMWDAGANAYVLNPNHATWQQNRTAALQQPAASGGTTAPPTGASGGSTSPVSGGNSSSGGTMNQQPGATPNTQPGIIGGAMTTTNTLTPEQVQAYNPYGNVAPNTNVQAQTAEVDPATQTVQGQLNSIISGDNELMQRARALATGEMGGRGLVSSTMNAQAGTAAVLDKALQIATPDAQIYSDRAMFNVNQQNQVGMFNAGEANKLSAVGADIAARFGLQQNEFSFTAGESMLDRASQEKLTQMKIASDELLQKAQLAHSASMTQMQIAADAANTDKSISAQSALQAAQQNFQTTQNELDRLQQANLFIKDQEFKLEQVKVEQDFRTNLLEVENAFKGSEAALDRENQRYLTEYQINAQQSNIPKSAVAEITIQLQNSIAQIASSGEMEASAKTTQIRNAYDAANASIQTISTLYNTELAGVGNVGKIVPGGVTNSNTTTPMKFSPGGLVGNAVNPGAVYQ